jgi:lipopolysaccharide transport system ATP-binding protein
MFSNETAIQVENLSKCYHIYNHPQDRLKQSILPRLQILAGRQPRNFFHEFWALRDVSFEIAQGETVGVIGKNGSGKSTLLQLIAGTLTPTSGTVRTSGRIAALLELGSGFNPEFTGRENVHLNGAILGLTQHEIEERFDDIAAFADIGEFIDQPVKIYSSGMFVRLAFSVNIMSKPDIMIVDEALAVGDIMFQAKCMTALKRRQDEGTTVLFVSHSVNAVKSLCSRAIYLDRGEVKMIGVASEVALHYVRAMREVMSPEQRDLSIVTQEQPALENSSQGVNGDSKTATARVLESSMLQAFKQRVALFRQGSGEARITYVELLDTSNNPITVVDFNQQIKLRIFFEAYDEKSLSVNFGILDSNKNNITGGNLILSTQSLLDVFPGDSFMVEYSLRLPLQDGIYSVQTFLVEPVVADQVANFIDVTDDAVVFEVTKWSVAKVWPKVYLFPNVEIKALVRKNSGGS